MVRPAHIVPPLLVAVALVGAAVGLAGCGSSHKQAPASTASPPAASATDRWGTTWLCRPDLADNPCLTDQAATLVEANGATRVEQSAPAAHPRVDCFYVYPTISDEPTVNADLAVGFRQEEVAIAQASRFSGVCRVYAPVYRQITLNALAHPRSITLPHALVAYGSVLAAFRDYLAHYNHGRGIVFIGHSQGATILIRLLQQEVDNAPAVRSRLVSALLLGGNVTVRKGGTLGGDFDHIPACTSARETGCVVAYSSFTSKPPPNSQFGRTSSDEGVGLLAPRRLSPSLQIMCVNPASPAGGTAYLEPYLPSLALTFLPREHDLGQHPLGGLPARVHGPLRDLRRRDLAPDQPARRQRRQAADARAAPGPDPRPARPRRQHRARRPRLPGRRAGGRLRPQVATAGLSGRGRPASS